MNPTGYADGRGTPGWRAPEQRHHDPRRDRLGACTNIWAIGAVLLRLMNQHSNVGANTFGGTTPGGPVLKERGLAYSRELRNAVLLCRNKNPEDRPSLRQLQDRIVDCTTPDTEHVDRAEGTRDQPNAAFALRIPQDAYRLGFAV